MDTASGAVGPHSGSALPAHSLYFAPHCDEFHRNPYPTYKLLQLLAPLMYWSEGKAWVMTRHADIVALYQDPRFSVHFRHWKEYEHTYLEKEAWKNFEAFDLHALSDADNQRLAHFVLPHFEANNNALLVAAIEEICTAKLAKVKRSQPFDLVADYAHGISVRTIARLFGLPEKYLSHFIHFAQAYVALLDPSMSYSHEELYKLMIKINVGLDLISDALQLRRQRGDDRCFVDHLLRAQHDSDSLSDRELLSLVAILVAEGLDSARLLIANTVYQLLTHADAYALLQAEPARWPNAVREVLRYDHFSKLGAPRYALEDCRLGERTISKGEMIYPIIAAAQRDPAVFRLPDEFDITRNTEPVIDLGFGTHPFMGLQLAALEAEVAARCLFAAMPHLTIETPPTYDPSHQTLRAMVSLRLNPNPSIQ